VEIGFNEIKIIIENIRDLMVKNKQEMIEADSLIGDGDLGLTMSKSFIAADEELKGLDIKNDVGKVFIKIGMIIAKASPSTMGTLVATGFMKGGKAVLGKEKLNTEGLFLFFKAFTEGIMDRGKAKIGDKTLLDVLYPMVNALEKNKEKSMNFAVNEGFQAAKLGLDKTKGLISQHGKAAIYREKTLGLRDPGGIAALYILQGFKEVLI